jgi:hypothetical protein
MLKTPAVVASAILLLSLQALAVPFSILIGDNDGYSLGIADNGSSGGSGFPGPSFDGRSVAEQAAVNGAQLTDVYSALFPGAGPHTTTIGTVTFALPGVMTSGTLTIDMGDFQASTFGQFSVSLNGVNKPNYFNFEDGFTNTAVHTFALSATDITNANLAGALTLTINRNGSNDYVAFDFFRLDGEATAAPVPDGGSTLALLGLTLGGIVVLQRKLSNRTTLQSV